MSVMLTCVLLKVARMLAMPVTMFLASLALTIFLPASVLAQQLGGGRRGNRPPARLGGLGRFRRRRCGCDRSFAGGAAFFGALAWPAGFRRPAWRRAFFAGSRLGLGFLFLLGSGFLFWFVGHGLVVG